MKDGGNLVITMPNDAFIEISPNGDGIHDSNILSPEMYDETICATKYKVQNNKTRTYPDMKLQESAKQKFVSQTMFDFGGRSQELRADRIRRSLQREDLN